MLHIVLYQPEIPHNTGAVGRLCLATGARLHLIRPLGFSLDDKYLKRSGLDYWHQVDVRVWENWENFTLSTGATRFAFIECQGAQPYWLGDFSGTEELYLVYGPETRGIPPDLMAAHPGSTWHIPMQPGARSLNLSTAVAITLYEAVRQRR